MILEAESVMFVDCVQEQLGKEIIYFQTYNDKYKNPFNHEKLHSKYDLIIFTLFMKIYTNHTFSSFPTLIRISCEQIVDKLQYINYNMKNTKIVNKHHRSLFQSNQKYSIKGINLSPSPSVKRSSNKSPIKHNKSVITVSQIPKIKQFTGISKLKLGRQQMEKIKRSLQIDHQTNLNYLKRLEAKDLYYRQKKANHNQGKLSRSISRQLQKQKSKPQIDVKLNIMQNKQPISIQIIQQRCPPMYLPTHRIVKINKEKSKIKYQVNPIEQSSIIQKISQVQEDPFQFFQRIDKIPQERYSQKMWKKKNINIFKLIKNDKQFLNSKQSIDQYHFCYDSITSINNQRRNGNIFRDLSSFSRKFAKNNYSVDHQYKFNETDLNFDQKFLGFSEIMLVATGYLEPKTLYSYLANYGMENIKNNDIDSHISQDLINYNDNTNNKATFYHISNYDHSEKLKYIQVAFTKQEETQLKSVQNKNLKVKEILETQLQTLRNAVTDKRITRKYQEHLDQLLHERLKPEKRRSQVQINRLIAKNKIFKSKIQNINIKLLRQIIIQKKEKDQQKKVFRRQSKSPNSKSPNPKSKWR